MQRESGRKTDMRKECNSELNMARQFLIFDADDTLWENNIYFESAFDEFCDFLAHASMSPADVRAVLDEIEIANAKVHGYGSRNFARNLATCYQHLAERQIAEGDLKIVMDFAHAILERPIELLDGVEETINELSERHALKEKNEPAYRQLALERGFVPGDTWMIGNSPKSDILPALSAGLNAVFVPHARTWSLEQSALPEQNPRLHTVENIRQLTRMF